MVAPLACDADGAALAAFQEAGRIAGAQAGGMGRTGRAFVGRELPVDSVLNKAVTENGAAVE